jgi:hypothetical protein
MLRSKVCFKSKCLEDKIWDVIQLLWKKCTLNLLSWWNKGQRSKNNKLLNKSKLVTHQGSIAFIPFYKFTKIKQDFFIHKIIFKGEKEHLKIETVFENVVCYIGSSLNPYMSIFFIGLALKFHEVTHLLLSHGSSSVFKYLCI